MFPNIEKQIHLKRYTVTNYKLHYIREVNFFFWREEYQININVITIAIVVLKNKYIYFISSFAL